MEKQQKFFTGLNPEQLSQARALNRANLNKNLGQTFPSPVFTPRQTL